MLIMNTEHSTRALLRHFLAALAYRTQKALRDAPPEFATFEAGNGVRQPHELVHHMTSVMGYTRTCFLGGTFRPAPIGTLPDEVRRFHEALEELGQLLSSDVPLRGVTEEQ